MCDLMRGHSGQLLPTPDPASGANTSVHVFFVFFKVPKRGEGNVCDEKLKNAYFNYLLFLDRFLSEALLSFPAGIVDTVQAGKCITHTTKETERRVYVK